MPPELLAIQYEMLRKECVVCIYAQTGEQPREGRALTVCLEHCDKDHAQVRAFFNESKVA